jgi:hypothetical protein
MPIGSLLVWRTGKADLKTYKTVGGIQVGNRAGNVDKVSYLIDGHQRVSTLFAALQARPHGDVSSQDDRRWALYFELGAARPAFRLAPRRNRPKHWLPLSILFDGDALFDFTQELRRQNQRDLARQAENLANIFRDYIVPIVPLVTDELNTVTDAFVRINSQGKGMSEAHMLRALTHLESIDTESRFASLRARVDQLGWGGIDDQVLVNVLKSILNLDMYAADVRRVHDGLRAEPIKLDILADAVCEAAKEFSGWGVRGPAALPYAYQFVAVATIAARYPGRLADSRVRKVLRRWFWATTYGEYFTGMTGTRIREAINELEEALFRGGGGMKVDPVEFEPIDVLRIPSVRGTAFLLFLAERAPTKHSRRKQQDLLAGDTARVVGRLFVEEAVGDPANRVIASPDDLDKLRRTLRSPKVVYTKFLEAFGIPRSAVECLPSRERFLSARRRWLQDEERVFVEKRLGYSLTDEAAD